VAACSKGSGSDGTPGAASDVTGVAECDEYVQKMEACLSKIPPESKASLEAGFKQAREGWKEQATSAAGKEGLKGTCKTALDSFTANPPCK
jgi:hypothetical protein